MDKQHYIEKKEIALILFLFLFLAGGSFFLRQTYIKNSANSAGKIAGIWQESSGDTLVVFDKTWKNPDGSLPESPTASASGKTHSILFVGDLMFDRYIREIAVKKGNDYIFEPVGNLLKEQDLVVANLEGPITENQSKSVGTPVGGKGHLVFTFDKSLAKTLAEKNIKVVNYGNNHILNFADTGFNDTKNNLKEADIEYFGDINGQNQYLIKTVGAIDLGFVNYNQFSPGSEDRVLSQIGDLKDKTDILIVYTHWGEEYKTEAPGNIKTLAHKFVDEGADLIIGTHPHVVENKEEYKGKMIYYSLGNFVFDQYFSEETKQGLAVKADINAENNEMKFEDINLRLDNSGQTKLDK